MLAIFRFLNSSADKVNSPILGFFFTLSRSSRSHWHSSSRSSIGEVLYTTELFPFLMSIAFSFKVISGLSINDTALRKSDKEKIPKDSNSSSSSLDISKKAWIDFPSLTQVTG